MSNDDNKEPIPIVVEPNSDDDEKEMKESLEIKSNVNKEDSIWKQNHEISKALEQVLDITDLIPVFNHPKSTLAKSFATTMEGNSKDLIGTQATLRQCCQSVMKVLSYKPANFDNNDQKVRWDLIHTFSAEIRKSVINVMDVAAEWFGFLTILYHGLAYFYQTMANGHGTLDVAIMKFQQAATEFAEFQEKNADAFTVVRKKSEEAMEQIEKTFGGGEAIKNAQRIMDKHQKEYAVEIEKLKKMESEKLDAIIPIKVEIAGLKGELAQYEVQLRYANDEISNIDKEQQFAADRARQNERKAENASNYRKELWCRTSYSWWGFSRYRSHYYKDVHTGDKDRLQGIADRYRSIRDKAKNEKAAKMEIKKLAAKSKTETEQKISAKEMKYNKTVKMHDDKINPQVVVVKAAKKRYEDDLKTIETAIKKYAVGEHSVADFLNSTQQLSQESLKALQATKTIDVNIKRLSQIISSQCETVWTIDTYFRRADINLSAMIEPFKENKCLTLEDIECDDEKEYIANILPLVKDKGNHFELKRIKKLCTNKQTISAWKTSQQTLGESNTANLMIQVPALSLFFPSLHRRLKFAWKMLKIADASDNKQILSILPVEIQELEAKDKKKIGAITLQINEMKAIEYDKDTKENDSSSTDSEEERRRRRKRKKRKAKQRKKDKKKKKKKSKKKKKKKRYTSSDEDSDSESESESESEEKPKRRRKKHSKKEKKKKKKYSSDSDSDDSDDSSDANDYKKKKNKKKKKKKKKHRGTSSDEDSKSESVSVSVSESEEEPTRGKGKTKAKKDKKKKYSSDSDDSDGSSSVDDKKKKKKKKKKKMVLKTETLTLSKLIDEDTAKCIDDDYEKVIILFDEDKWYKKLKKLLKKGEKEGVDVKLKVSTIDKGKKIKYTITDAYLDD